MPMHIKRLFRILLFIFASTAILMAQPARRPLKLDDLARLREVRDPQISPDGSQIVYSVGQADRETQKRGSQLWLSDRDGGNAVQLTQSGKSNGGAAAKQKTGSGARPKTQPRATKKGTSSPSAKTAPTKPNKQPAAAPAATPEPRRFAWAPVDGAVGYRFELFRGNEQVLEVRTKTPAYELAGQWRHAGKTERLSPGGYKWYVWPVFSSGPASAAVVQANLSIR